MSEGETFGPLLHGTARAWRLKLDERLKPMGLSQAKWRTLLHLSLAGDSLTQAEIAERLGIEEPSLVTLLHRLEYEDWIIRKTSAEGSALHSALGLRGFCRISCFSPASQLSARYRHVRNGPGPGASCDRGQSRRKRCAAVPR